MTADDPEFPNESADSTGVNHQNSVLELAFDNGSSKSDSLTVGCRRKRNASKKCYHARTDPIGRGSAQTDVIEG